MASAINAQINLYVSQIKDWSKTTNELVDEVLANDYLTLKDSRNEIIKNIEAAKESMRNKMLKAGGIEMSVILKNQDLLGLKSNSYDEELGSNFLLASSDGGQTSAIYWILKDRSVIRLKTGMDSVVQLASPEILEDVLWPLFIKMKNNILDKLNSMCPFKQLQQGVFPWGNTSKFVTTMQDCGSSWILEHFGDIGLNYKAVPSKETDKNGTPEYWTISSFTDVYTQLSKDMFVKTFNTNLPLLCGRYAKRLDQHPLPYSYEDSDYAFTKLKIDEIVKEGKCPTWDKALEERLENEEECAVFRAAVWQVYEVKNKSRQIIYMYDPHGRSGKSAMLRAAFSHLSQATQALQKNSLNNQFGFAKIWNKQLVTIGDNKSTMMLKSQIIHTATGGDLADVEYKGKDSFAAAFQGHIWANGNVKLDIDTDAEHEVSRLVLFNIKKPKSAQSILYQCDKNGDILMSDEGTPLLSSGDPNWEQTLKDELPYFLYKCKEDYKKYCPRNSDIILPAFMQNRIQEECSELKKIIFDDFLNSSVILGSGEVTDAQLRDTWKEWKDNNMERYETNISFADLVEHLSKLKYKCIMRKFASGKRLRVWPNISLNVFKPLKDQNEGKNMNDFD